MSAKERYVLTAVLLVISFVTGVDLITDANEGVVFWHMTIEAFVILLATAGVILLLKDTFKLKRSLVNERRLSLELQQESERWQENSRKYLQGLSQSINQQLTAWNLTDSEKEVAFLLLKGFSLKEIADIRQTMEKTARTQATSIYSKAGLSGRAQLAAFFLEELLVPYCQLPPPKGT